MDYNKQKNKKREKKLSDVAFLLQTNEKTKNVQGTYINFGYSPKEKICKHKHYGEFNMFNGDDVIVWTCLDCMQSIDKPQKEKLKEFIIIFGINLIIIIFLFVYLFYK